ncbi:hypothetical protein BD410DRAFT_814169 [Rickenella mellea]|uniref:RING-type domain-containing protein n=1 Tax=Rickenella mellea TaxID=50990 RepID=A0A4Y7Q8I2_9AGAM|nr:hypothetical protein BD410DRAFT_814169 [Rickenella mellea]
MVSAPLPVVSSRDHADDEEECPVCLEPLSFSFRLPGEKPHIVPECGHALHEACFTAVYGPPPGQNRGAAAVLPRKSNLGVCGVCRRPMKVGDGDGSKSNKLAALTGMGDRNSSGLYPGRETPSTGPRRPQTAPHSNRPFDPTDDDPVEHAAGSIKSAGSGSHGHDERPSAYIVAPSIQVRPEFSSLTRSTEPSQLLTCIVIIELPSRRTSSYVPGPVMQDAYRSSNNTPVARHPHHQSQTPSEQSESTIRSRQPTMTTNGVRSPSPERSQLSSSPRDTDIGSLSPLTPNSPAVNNNDSPFKAITEDLRTRIIDWKGHPLSGLGPLQMFDLLSVRRDSIVREFFVYLFKEAIICVEEEKRRTFGRLLSSGSGSSSAFGEGGTSAPGRGVLKLKGRIYVRHIKHVTDTSIPGELSLTIDMEDERLESFILIFKDRASLETWRTNIIRLVTMFQEQQRLQNAQRSNSQSGTGEMDEFGGSAKAARMLSGSTSTTNSSERDSLLNGNGSVRSSSTSHGSSMASPNGRMGLHNTLAPLGEDDELYTPPNYGSSPTGLVTPHLSSGPSNSLTPLPHPPLDLLLVISLPPQNSTPSTAALKVRVIKTTLDFVIASLGMRDRLSIVTFEVGPGGRVWKTPFLCVGRGQSRGRLTAFVENIGAAKQEGDIYVQEFLVRGAKEEKADVVTAVNHGLDVVLQRKNKNPISGMLLISDAADSTRRAQMDLVLARAEAANVPIHSFGYGRSHDPASLWLMSNHTGGTYTFVKDWYDLRECVAGCIGGLMSIGILHMKMHLKIVDGHRFRIRKVSGGPNAIVASDGRDVDVDVGEIRYGERKEMLVELELDNTDSSARAQRENAGRNPNATDQFVQRMGLESLSLEESGDFVDGMMDRMIDEVPVFEVDGSFYDPAATKQVSRLAHPVLLTVTLLPLSGSRPRTPTGGSDPVIVRRRMELLSSEMITRALVLVSRKNYPQALNIMNETRRILHTVLNNITQTLPPPSTNGNTIRNRKELLTLSAVRAIQAVLQDMQVLVEALEENVELFAHDQRNFGAQQAMILRDQKSWSGRTLTEKLFWTTDNSIELVSRSTDWVARD